jgi:hypothetical protein
MSRVTGFENDAIEDAVDDIPRGTCQHECYTHDKSRFVIVFYQSSDIEDDQDDRNNTEERQKEFSSRLNTESHPIILHEINPEPVGNRYGVVQSHMRFHPYFGELVDQKDHKNNGYGHPGLAGTLFHPSTVTFLFFGRFGLNA